MKKNRKRFSSTHAVLAVVGGFVMVLGGWFAYMNHRDEKPANITAPAVKQTESSDPLKTYTFAGGSVSFQAPKDWYYDDNLDRCSTMLPTGNNTDCIGGFAVFPPGFPEANLTNDTGGSSYAVILKAFRDDTASTSEEWFKNVYAGDASHVYEGRGATGSASTLTMNGMSVYVYKNTHRYIPGIGQNGVSDINYVFHANNKFVLVTASTEEFTYIMGVDGKEHVRDHADFAQYIPTITAIAQSVKIH